MNESRGCYRVSFDKLIAWLAGTRTMFDQLRAIVTDQNAWLLIADALSALPFPSFSQVTRISCNM